ncbi:MAG: MMPL family transporter [Streptosporangiaceae bacterium]
MDRFFAGLGRSVVRFRFLVVLLWIVAALVSTKALPSMSSEVNNDNSQFLSSSAPSSKADALATPLLGNTARDSQVIVVASRSAGTLTAADQSTISREVTAIRKVPLVLSVHEAGTAPDGKAAQIIVVARVNSQDIAAQKTLVDDVQAALPPAQATAGLQFHLAGTVATNVANQGGSNSTGNKIQVFSVLFIVILLLAIFRSLLAPLVTLIPAVFALLISMRFIGGLGAHGLQISEITELLLIVLLLGAGTDYGLFLVFRVREEIRAGRAPKDAVAYSLVRVAESISASAGTVILALLTLLLASFGIYKDLGVPLAVGVAVMLLAGLTLLPALLAIFGRAVFWPSRVAPGTGKDGLWGKIAGRLVRRPALTLGIGLACFLGLASAALGYHSGGFGGATNAPAGSQAAAGNAIVAQNFPQASANPANLIFRYPGPVWDDPGVLATADSSLRSSGEFTALSGPLDPNGQVLTAAQYAHLHAELGPAAALPPREPAALTVPAADYDAYRATSQYVSGDGQIIQFEATLKAGGQQTTAALNATPAIRATVTAAAKASGATDSGVAGEAASLYDVSSASNHDLTVIIPVAVLAIGLLLALVLRSLVAPLYLIVSVALSYLAALGVATLLFIDIGGEGGLTFILPFLMFIFLLALGEDYNILVMTRIREESRQLPLREAVIRAIGRTGPTVTSAGLVLAGTFGVLAVVAGGSGSGGSQIRDIGAGLAIGILMDTFLVRTLLVPSTVALLGRRNWWPSAMGRRSTGSSHADTGPAAISPAGQSPARRQ